MLWKWRRNLFVWEQKLVEDLLSILHGFVPCINKDDVWRWKWEGTGAFTVKSAYRVLTQQQNETQSTLFKNLWKADAPMKLRAFAWRVLQNRVPTMANLIRRGINANGGNSTCTLCNSDVEDANHLFCNCSITHRIWMNIHEWFGIKTAIAGNIVDHHHQFRGLVPFTKWGSIWQSLWFFTIWQIWISRNNHYFKGELINIYKAVESIKVCSWSYLKSKHRDFPYSFVDWSNSPMLCL